MNCETCGRQRWSGDRYCAGCGAAFADGLHAGLVDLDEVANIGDLDDKPASRRRESLIGLGVLTAILALIALAVVGGGSSPDEELAADDLELPAEIEPTSTPTTEPTPPATPTPTGRAPQPTPRPTATPLPGLPEVIRDLELGGGWLATLDPDRYPVAVNLETGDEIVIPEPVPSAFVAYFDEHGVYIASEMSPSSLRWFGSWSGDETPRVPTPSGSFVVGSFTDPTHGSIVVSLQAPESPESPQKLVLLATSLSTGATKTVPISPGALDSITGNSGPGLAVGGALGTAPYLATQADGAVWGWSWDDIWTRIAPGTISGLNATFAIIESCPTPTECTMIRYRHDGSSPEPLSLAVGSGDHNFSPNGTKVARQVFVGRMLLPLEIIDLESAATTTTRSSSSFFTQPIWSPNDRYLFVQHYEGHIEIIDADTGLTALRFSAPDSLSSIVNGPNIHEFAFLPTIGS